MIMKKSNIFWYWLWLLLLVIVLLIILFNSMVHTSIWDDEPSSPVNAPDNNGSWETNIFNKWHMTSVMQEYWFSSEESSYIYDNCSTRNNPEWCVKLFTHVSWHETKTGTLGVGKSKNNLPWLKKCWSTSTGTYCYHPYYPNRMASFEDWVEKYDQYWYNNDCMEMIDKSEYTPHNPWPWISNCERMMGNFTQ